MAELFLANLKNKFIFLISVQVDILVRPYTMDLIPLANINPIEFMVYTEKGVVGNLTRFAHENGVLLQQDFLVNWAHLGGS